MGIKKNVEKNKISISHSQELHPTTVLNFLNLKNKHKIMNFMNLMFLLVVFLCVIPIIYSSYTALHSNYILNISNPANLTYTENYLNDTSLSKNLTFTWNENKTVYIEIPKNAVVTLATFNVSGHANQVLSNISSIYTPQSPYCWNNSVTSLPPSSMVGGTELSTWSSDAYSSLSSDDITSSYFNTYPKQSVGDYGVLSCNFTISEDISTITKLEIIETSVGYGEGSISDGLREFGHSVYIWNYSSNSYDLVYTQDTSTLSRRVHSLFSISDYISNSVVNVLIVSKIYTNNTNSSIIPWESTPDIYYLAINVTYEEYIQGDSYPSNVYIDIGDDETIDWEPSNVSMILDYTYDVADTTASSGSYRGLAIKWNISEIPSGVNINSANLCLGAYHIAGSPDNDIIYWRIDNQTWDETITYSEFNNFSLTNETYTTSNNTALGYWCFSILNAVSTDYSLGNNYTSVRVMDGDFSSVTTDYVMDGYNYSIGIDTEPFVTFTDRENIGNKPILELSYSPVDFNLNENVNNILDDINDYLSSCTSDEFGNCQIPILVHSDTPGIIKVHSIHVQYTIDIHPLIQIEQSWNQTQDVVSNTSYNIIRKLYWNRSFKVPNNITIDGVHIQSNSTLVKWDNIVHAIYNQSAPSAFINITDIVITQNTDLSTLVNHTLEEDGYSGMPVIQTETYGQISSGIWSKNVSILYKLPNGSTAPAGKFTNTTFTTTIDDTQIVSQEFIKWWNGTDWLNITPSTCVSDCNTTNPTWEKKIVDSNVFYVCMQDVNGDKNGVCEYFKVKIESSI